MTIRTLECPVTDANHPCWRGLYLNNMCSCGPYNNGKLGDKNTRCPFKRYQAAGMTAEQYLANLPSRYATVRLEEPLWINAQLDKNLWFHSRSRTTGFEMFAAAATSLMPKYTVAWLDLEAHAVLTPYIQDKSKPANIAWHQHYQDVDFLFLAGLGTTVQPRSVLNFASILINVRSQNDRPVFVLSNEDAEVTLARLDLAAVQADLFDVVTEADVKTKRVDVQTEISAVAAEADRVRAEAERGGVTPAFYRRMEEIVAQYRAGLIENLNLVRPHLSQARLLGLLGVDEHIPQPLDENDK